MEEKSKRERYVERHCECGHVLNIERGEYVCSKCGLVDLPVFDGGRLVDREGNITKSLKTYRTHDKLLGSYIDMRRSPYKLRNAIRNTYIPGILQEMLMLSERITSIMRLSPIIKERVGYLIHNYPLDEIKKCNKETAVAACVYIACEDAQLYRPLGGYGIYCNDDFNNFFKVVKTVKTHYNLKTKRFTPDMYIPFIIDNIGLDESFISDAEVFITTPMSYKHNPKSWAAAAVVLAATMCGIKIDMNEICKIVGISIPTLKERIKQIVD